MLHNKNSKKSGDLTRASVTEEMAKPRMSRSARISELNLDALRIPEPPRTAMSGIVIKIIPSPTPGQPQNTDRAIEPADLRTEELRIENTATHEQLDPVRLKKRVLVEVTVTSGPKNRQTPQFLTPSLAPS